MKRKIFLIGLNLYSVFLALQIKSKAKNSSICIIEGSPNFISAYKKIKIKNYILNPGFHALEDVRSRKLVNVLKKEIKFIKIRKTRGMIIGKELISHLDGYKEWPKNILQKFKIRKKNVTLNPIKDLNYLNKNYLRYLTDNYFGKENDIKYTISSSYPWFFPSNYKIKSNDEAAVFTKKVRQKKIKHSFIFPERGHFSEISNALRIILRNNNIDVKLNIPITFKQKQKQIFFDGYDDLNNTENKKIICIPVKPLNDSIKKQKLNELIKKKRLPKLKPIKYYTALIEIKNYIKSELDKFCEIIVSSEYAYGLIRISQYSDVFNIKNKKIYQIEFIEHSEKSNINEQLNDILQLFKNFISFKNSSSKNIKLIGYSLVRNIFRPNKKDIQKITSSTISFFKNKKNIIFPRQITWPINSNKHLLYAEEDYKKKILKFLNDRK
ncbi:hypothetical protein [Candidatus Pelagibacter sp. HIMB1495]|uniref:hypothetical protein n=1 Tax=unclassified Candidatus Pelagibacter TaxID=2647897 RepID=UPI003F87D2D5